MICLNTFLLSTPGISKSAAAPLLAQCCEVGLEPINSHNSGDLNPEVTLTGN